MSKEWNVLVASANLEHRRELVRILAELPLNVISVSTFQQAEEVLSRQHIALMFSDQRLPDGSFRELLSHTHLADKSLVHPI
jgi:DNA-binding NtrC family response regulator